MRDVFETTVVWLLLGCGVYLSIAMKLFPVFKLRKVTKLILSSLFHSDNSASSDKLTPFEAMSTTLAGTLGVGSISGIATAITIGGAGAVFWMIISAVLGMSTKYAEIFLSVYYPAQKNKVGGPMSYLQKASGGAFLPSIFCVCCVLASFGTGSMVQSNSISQSLSYSFNIPAHISGLIVTLLAGAVVIGSVKRIAYFSSKIVPIMSVMYLLLAFSAILLNIHRLLPAFELIFKSAFNFKSALGGAFGVLTNNAIRYGVSRGIFSNEAGLGSSPIAHACSSGHEPVKEGLLGIFEVFLDTVVMCTITALVLLTSPKSHAELDASALTAACFSDTFGALGEKFVSVSIVFFAFSSIIGWCFYSEQCLKYLFKKPYYPILIYRIVYLLSVLSGAVMKLAKVWAMSDFFNMAMALPNIFGVLILSPTVIKETNNFFSDSKLRRFVAVKTR